MLALTHKRFIRSCMFCMAYMFYMLYMSYWSYMFICSIKPLQSALA